MELLEKCYSDIGLQFKPQEIDRAHRIGKTYSVNDTRITTKDIIVKYKSWGPRSAFYKARPKFFKNGARMETRPTFSVALDLTKRRYDLLNHAREKSKSYPDVQFAFVDINCSLVVKGELTFKIWVCFFLTKMFQLLQKYYMQSFTAVAFSKLKL